MLIFEVILIIGAGVMVILTCGGVESKLKNDVVLEELSDPSLALTANSYVLSLPFQSVMFVVVLKFRVPFM